MNSILTLPSMNFLYGESYDVELHGLRVGRKIKTTTSPRGMEVTVDDELLGGYSPDTISRVLLQPDTQWPTILTDKQTFEEHGAD